METAIMEIAAGLNQAEIEQARLAMEEVSTQYSVQPVAGGPLRMISFGG